MLIAISGTRGLLGSELKSHLTKKGHQVIDVNRPDYDITNYNAMDKLFRENKIDVFFNCAAFTDVPGAEKEGTKQKKDDLAYQINDSCLSHLSHLCGEEGTHLIHFSTDFVFDGKKPKGSIYTEKDTVNPVNHYGVTKLGGEKRILENSRLYGWDNFTIFRIQWLYGENEKNFFYKILQAAKSGKQVTLVDDEYGSPCSAAFISIIMGKVLEKGLDNFKGEVYHLSHVDTCTRYTCGKYFLNALGYRDVKPVSNLPVGAVQRPKNTSLGVLKLVDALEYSLGIWMEDLDFYIKTFKKSEQVDAV